MCLTEVNISKDFSEDGRNKNKKIPRTIFDYRFLEFSSFCQFSLIFP